MNNGYEEVQINNKHYYKHRLVAKQILGRDLKPEEVVHHIDENRANNSKDNLMVFRSTRDHSLFHSGYKIKKVKGVWRVAEDPKLARLCPICKKNIMGKKKSKSCAECYRKLIKKGRKVNSIPSRKTLKKLIQEKSFVKIGEMYSVTDNAVRKWCKKYDLPYRKRDIINMK